MKVIYIGKEKEDFLISNNNMDLIPQKQYEVLDEDKYFYRIIDESGEDYRYPKSFFKIINNAN